MSAALRMIEPAPPNLRERLTEMREALVAGMTAAPRLAFIVQQMFSLPALLALALGLACLLAVAASANMVMAPTASAPPIAAAACLIKIIPATANVVIGPSGTLKVTC